MRASTLASLLFSGLALAGPVRKRDDVVTDVIVETVWTTTTIYVDGPTDAAFFEVAASTASSSGSSSAVSTSSAAPSSSAAPPPPSASPPAPSPPPQLKVAEAPKPVVPVAAPQVKQAAAPAVAAAPAAGSMTGEGTWYDVSVGLGSCGKSASNSQPVVALAAAYMKNGVNPNANPLCGKTIHLTYGGKTTTAIVHDTCPECAAGDVDLAPDLFKTVFPNGDGRVGGLTWYLS